uniref:Uncharacterized protein n=1 Tax=Candida parapsilosis (strain CDC 317 / ATCC MYA-4646) TaxID=578454 RepID=A0AAJ8VW25_CANPC
MSSIATAQTTTKPNQDAQEYIGPNLNVTLTCSECKIFPPD